MEQGLWSVEPRPEAGLFTTYFALSGLKQVVPSYSQGVVLGFIISRLSGAMIVEFPNMALDRDFTTPARQGREFDLFRECTPSRTSAICKPGRGISWPDRFTLHLPCLLRDANFVVPKSMVNP
jgi:hypothetical protein